MAAGEDMEVDSLAVDIVDVEKDAKRFENYQFLNCNND